MSLIIIIIGLYIVCRTPLASTCIAIYFALNYSISVCVICAMKSIDDRRIVEIIKLKREAKKQKRTTKRGKQNVYTYLLLILNGHFVICGTLSLSCSLRISFLRCRSAAMTLTRKSILTIASVHTHTYFTFCNYLRSERAGS